MPSSQEVSSPEPRHSCLSLWDSDGAGPAGVDMAVDLEYNVALWPDTSPRPGRHIHLCRLTRKPDFRHPSCSLHSHLAGPWALGAALDLWGASEAACSAQAEQMVQRPWGRDKLGGLDAARGPGLQRREQGFGDTVVW